MPIYEYECEKCIHEFSKLQKNSNCEIPLCPLCKSKCKKLISKSSFVLVGEGFYVNDYKNKGKNNEQ